MERARGTSSFWGESETAKYFESPGQLLREETEGDDGAICAMWAEEATLARSLFFFLIGWARPWAKPWELRPLFRGKWGEYKID